MAAFAVLHSLFMSNLPPSKAVAQVVNGSSLLG